MASAQEFLNLFREYDDFLDSLQVICDMGCGSSHDIAWWATLESRDDPPIPYNYHCYAVDNNPNRLKDIPDLKNIFKINRNFNEPNILPGKVDFIWSYDSLQYSYNPLETLSNWYDQMNTNGMLAISVPHHSGVLNNRYYSAAHNGCLYHHTPANLIYMLALSGFDCADAFLLKRFNDPYTHIAVYKTDIEPMDPKTTSLYDLVDTGLLHWSAVNSINRHGAIKQEELCYTWLDKNIYFIDYVSAPTEIPAEAGEPIVDGVINKTVKSEQTTIVQAGSVTKTSELLKPVGIMRPPKGRYVK